MAVAATFMAAGASHAGTVMSHRRRHDDRRRSPSDDDDDRSSRSATSRSRSRSASRSRSRSRSREESPARDDDDRQQQRRRRDDDRDSRRRRRNDDERDSRHRDRERRHHRRSPDADERWRQRPYEQPPHQQPPAPALSDWYCRCGALNFKRRNMCYRQHCAATRAEATGTAVGGAGITKRLALGGLDTRSGEESVVRALQTSAPAAAARLAGVVLASPGAGTCFLSYSTVADAMDAYGALLAARLRINGRKVTVAYHPEAWGSAAPAGAAPPQALPPVPPAHPPFTAEDVPRMASYSAQLYATTPQEQQQYVRYYTAYYTRQLAAQPSEADRVNAAAAVAHSAISQLHARSGAPTFVEERVYPTPDTSLYVYDDSSGYYYDPSTGLYYDATTQYYYNSHTGQYLYWNAAKMTYSSASAAHANVHTAQAAAAAAAAVATAAEPAPQSQPDGDRQDEKRKPAPPDKQDKIKVAKKIAKDMERWAKTLNQKKDTAKHVAAVETVDAGGGASSGSADIGFSVLESRAPPSAPRAPPAPPLVPSYGAGSDSSGDEDEPIFDYDKLACLLCKRQFPSRDVLEKHARLSELHSKNLEAHERRRRPLERREPVYRDRAAERRLKHGEDDPPPAPRARSPPSTEPRTTEIREDNVGNRLLQKMGWSEGQGLGREGQGRVEPLEARTGPVGAGLGQKRGIYTAGPGETYRDCVKKLMIARYQDLVENEASS